MNMRAVPSEVKIVGFLALIQVLFSIVGRCDTDFRRCNYNTLLKPNDVIFAYSPNYPNYSPSGVSCLYTATAPQDYEIIAECEINLPKGTTGCTSEYFYISRDGDTNLRGADQFCGSGTVTRTSLFRKIVMAYVSSGSNGVGGRFLCKLTTRPQSCDCGWSQSTRIVGGQETSIGEFPSMVALYHVPTKTVFCGGAIISHRTVVTAAHCTNLFPNPNEVLIVTGDHDLSSATESEFATTYSVYRYIQNAAYNSTNEYNDISLLITTKDIEWNRGVGPVCLPFDQTYNDFTNTNVNIIGWGTTSFGGSRSNTLQKASVNIVANSACKQIYPSLAAAQVCTYFPNRDSCQFDSGGPVIYKGSIREFLLGVISYGNSCGLDPGVNTRITSYINWIISNTVGSVCPKAFV